MNSSSKSCIPSEGRIVLSWTERYGFLWLKKRTITAEARQLILDDSPELTSMTVAYVIINTNDGNCTVNIDIKRPSGNNFLRQQVFTYASSPTFFDVERKRILLKFCRKCKRVEAKEKSKATLHWSGRRVCIQRHRCEE